ncbi:hypothetical protein [Methylotuvimicrobium buryatense]|uniref:hypothetical protein n=1 Tax=Methylotuvimicrobium buryatense TaxID=95641 RepID=UPI0003466838|nr:hypothetical protein [Methylotuvimicrobium buryatense]
MNETEQAKKVRRLTAIIYIVLMIFLVIGTLYSEQRKEQAREAQKLAEQGIIEQPFEAE